jgi:hypothetical protein
MGQYPRYTTFKEGELEAALEKMGASGYLANEVRAGGTVRGGGPAGGLQKSHVCTVAYPDGTEGVCRYTRGGPTWHLFLFEHTGRDGKTTFLPRQTTTFRLENRVAVIEEKARDLAGHAFAAACRQERELFQRASLGLGSKPVGRPQMKVSRAKELAGKYALCQAVGHMLIPVTAPFESLEEANAAWEQGSDHHLVVACCFRRDRVWKRLRYNPLHARPDYPRPGRDTEDGETSPTEVTCDDETEEEDL